MLTTSEYADQIMAMVDEDIAAGKPDSGKRMPSDVDSFSALHDYRDANCYLLDLFDAHELDSPGAQFVFSDEGTDVCNAICDEVARRLAERAPQIRRRMAETVLFAIAAGFDGVYGEYSETSEYFNADPDDFEVDDEDVDAAAAWLAEGKPSREAVAAAAGLFAWAHGDCDGVFTFYERLPKATVYACGTCGQHRVQQDDPAAHSAAIARLADALIDAAEA